MRNSIALALIAAAAGVLAGSANAATPVSASMSLTVIATIVDKNETTNGDISGDAWGTALSSLAIKASATNGSGSAGVLVGGRGRADWASANAGSVSFDNYSWDLYPAMPPPPEFPQPDPYPTAKYSLNSGGPDWTYTFVAGAGDRQLRMAYGVSSGNFWHGGFRGWSIAVAGGPEVSQLGQALTQCFFGCGDHGWGVFEADLTPGAQYTVSLGNNGQGASPLCPSCVGRGSSDSFYGRFDWEIAPIPEPSTYALMALGLVGIGLLSRRRRNEPRPAGTPTRAGTG